jgi:16S rRNA (adenine1518-N6/adenine1519-N6)-dimethyltransferase
MAGPRAKKWFGQHFLHERSALERIAALCEAGPGDTVIEIGPGTGNLTEALAATTAGKIVAVERDPELLPWLAERLEPGRVEVVQGDATAIDFAPWLSEGRTNVFVGNLPYNAASPIYFRLLEMGERARRLVLMFQLEVAQRIAAEANTSAYGIPSVLTALYGTASLAFKLRPGAFEPPPKVSSAVVVVDLAGTPRLDTGGSPTGFTRFVRAAFGSRRKTLTNALGQAGFERPRVEDVLVALGIDPRARAEALTPEALASVFVALRQSGTGRAIEFSSRPPSFGDPST